jgi:DNA polymerase-4
VPVSVLDEAFGAHGAWMARAAAGIDDSPVSDAWEPSKSMSEERTFPKDVGDRSQILGVLRRMMDDLEVAIRQEGYWYKTVALKLRYADFTTLTRQASLAHHAQDTTMVRQIVPQLLDELLNDPRPVRLVGLRFGELAHALGQRDLPSFEREHGSADWPPDFRPRGQMRLEGEPT